MVFVEIMISTRREKRESLEMTSYLDFYGYRDASCNFLPETRKHLSFHDEAPWLVSRLMARRKAQASTYTAFNFSIVGSATYINAIAFPIQSSEKANGSLTSPFIALLLELSRIR